VYKRVILTKSESRAFIRFSIDVASTELSNIKLIGSSDLIGSGSRRRVN
jgi:hypothetical protein